MPAWATISSAASIRARHSGRIDERQALDVVRPQLRRTDLREHLTGRAGSGPRVDGADQAVERQLGADRHEDHRTAPA